MIYVVKVTEAAGQYRITLPKAFCEKHEIKEIDYLVINDEDQNQITIGRLINGGSQKAKSGRYRFG